MVTAVIEVETSVAELLVSGLIPAAQVKREYESGSYRDYIGDILGLYFDNGN